jgi:hypothetical protein
MSRDDPSEGKPGPTVRPAERVGRLLSPEEADEKCSA